MSVAASLLGAGVPPHGAVALAASAWRSLRARHFGYAAWAGLGIGGMQSVGEAMAVATVKWPDFLITLAFHVLMAELLLLALAVATRVRTRRMPKWLPFVLAAIAVAIIAGVVELLVFLTTSPELPPPRKLAIGITSNLVIYLMLLILASLGYMRGLDAWRRATALRELQLERTRMSRKAFEARLQALQARVDPRFLFETLAAIEATYEANPARGQRIIDDLIAYLRAALPLLEEAATPLRAEIALVRSWLDLMSLRHGERLAFSIAVSDPDLEARMPPMVLQPLVQHAVESVVAGAVAEPRVAIAITRGDHRLRLAVTTSGAALSDAGKAPALRAIVDRLDALYGSEATLTFHWVNRDDSRADLDIPYEIADRDHR